MNKTYLSAILLTFFTQLNLQAQTCNCKSNFEWVKTTFEQNDAGFDYVVQLKGLAEYQKHSELFAAKTATITDMVTCTEEIYNWLKFFRKGHIAIELSTQPKTTTSKPVPIVEELVVDVPRLKQQLDSAKTFDYTGIWSSGAYTVAIVKQQGEWVGSVLASNNKDWLPNQVKLKIASVGSNKETVYFMGDHSLRIIKQPQLLGANILKLDDIMFRRMFSKWPDNPALELEMRCLQAKMPLCEKINNTTVLLRIPSFDESQKRSIDSLLADKEKLIAKSKYLIIDLRNNGGGSDISFQGLLPYLYTQPIREVGVRFLSTNLNNQRMLLLAEDPDFTSEDRQWAKRSYDTLQNHLGEFVDLGEGESDEVVIAPKKKSPAEVIVLVNEYCASTTEQFLLAARQSKKVKLLGRTTFGALDISNMNFVSNPCDEFKLGYCLSKSKRIPDLIIDNRGIQPDYFMDDAIDETDWIQQAIKIVEAK